MATRSATECVKPAVEPAPPTRGSVAWRYFGDMRATLLGPSVLVLQVAHPTVGAGVLEHSDYKNDPWGRLVRTFLSLSTLIYGGPSAAKAEADRLREMHRTFRGVDVKGRRYHALNPEAYAWVHATLVKGAVDAHEMFGRPLPSQLLTEYYRELRQVGRLLGLPERHLPPDWPSFLAYYEDKVAERLEENRAVWDVINSVREPAKPTRLLPDLLWRPFALLAGRNAYLVTVGTLPIQVRERLGLPWTSMEQRRLRRYAVLVRCLMAAVPPPLRCAPALTMAYWNSRRTAGQGRLPQHTS